MWEWAKGPGARQVVRAHDIPAAESRSVSIADPAVAMLLGYSIGSTNVSEQTALTLSAVWRAVSLIAGSIAGLPLRTLQDDPDGQRERVSSFLDSPAGPDRMTPYEWTELVLVHQLLHGNAYLQHLYNGAGALVGLWPIHPTAVTVETDPDAVGGKRFTVRVKDAEDLEFECDKMTHLYGLSLDGVTGLSPITVARMSLSTGMSGDKAANRMFSNGLSVSAVATPEDEITEEDAQAVKLDLNAKMTGEDNAGGLAIVNRRLKFQQMSQSAEDAQFLQSRAFQIEEVARWYGVPPHLLAQTDKQTSWGTGVAEQNRGLARYTLTNWTSRMEQRLSRLLASNRKAEFDYSGFVQASPEVEIPLLIAQVNAGLLTPDEARRIRNLPPLPNGAGAAIRVPAPAPAAPTVPIVGAPTEVAQ